MAGHEAGHDAGQKKAGAPCNFISMVAEEALPPMVFNNISQRVATTNDFQASTFRKTT